MMEERLSGGHSQGAYKCWPKQPHFLLSVMAGACCAVWLMLWGESRCLCCLPWEESVLVEALLGRCS